MWFEVMLLVTSQSDRGLQQPRILSVFWNSYQVQNIVVPEETKGNMRQFGRAIGLMNVEISTLLLVEDIQPFAGRILADGVDFIKGRPAVYLGV